MLLLVINLDPTPMNFTCDTSKIPAHQIHSLIFGYLKRKSAFYQHDVRSHCASKYFHNKASIKQVLVRLSGYIYMNNIYDFQFIISIPIKNIDNLFGENQV